MRLATALLCSAALLAGPAAASETHAEIVAACGAELNVPDTICTCIADQAVSDLSAPQQSFLLLVLNDPDNAARLAPGLGIGPRDMQAAAMFMVKTPQACAMGTE